MGSQRLLAPVAACLLWMVSGATQDDPPEAPLSVSLDPRELQIRDRYEQALARNPLQDQAFDRVYALYLTHDGLDAWAEKLKAAGDSSPTRLGDLILLGRIHERQFKTAEAIQYLEQARALGENRPELLTLLGTLYYSAGRDEEAGATLAAALDSLTDPEKRARVCRILGNLHLRQGKKDEALATWKRLVEQSP